jgi:hypothetical protein
MKTVKYRNMYGVGETSDPWENTSLEEFVKLVPALTYDILAGKVMPSLKKLNDIFKTNESNTGMSGHIMWKPFEIDENEYKDLVEILCTDPNLKLVAEDD